MPLPGGWQARVWVVCLVLCACCLSTAHAASPYDNPDTLVVSRDGTGQFRNIGEAIDL